MKMAIPFFFWGGGGKVGREVSEKSKPWGKLLLLDPIN